MNACLLRAGRNVAFLPALYYTFMGNPRVSRKPDNEEHQAAALLGRAVWNKERRKHTWITLKK